MKKILLTICLLLIAAPVFALNVTATWDPVDKATGYKLYHGTESKVYGTPDDSGGKTTITIPIVQGQDDMTVYFAVTAYNQYGESPYSVEVPAVIPGLHAIPVSPEIQRIDINLLDKIISIFKADGSSEAIHY